MFPPQKRSKRSRAFSKTSDAIVRLVVPADGELISGSNVGSSKQRNVEPGTGLSYRTSATGASTSIGTEALGTLMTVAVDCTIESESVLSCVFSLFHAAKNAYFTMLKRDFAKLVLGAGAAGRVGGYSWNLLCGGVVHFISFAMCRSIGVFKAKSEHNIETYLQVLQFLQALEALTSVLVVACQPVSML